MRISRLGCVLVLLLGLPVPSEAQDPTHVDFQIFRQATPPVSVSAVYSIPFTSFDCTQPRTPPPANVVNPRTYRFDDWRTTNRDCVYTEPLGGPLTVLPFDQTTTYFVRGTTRNAAGSSLPSDSNSFQRPGLAPTASPANLRVGPSQ